MPKPWSVGRVAAYYRTSSEQQERDETIDSQCRFNRRYCEQREWNLVAEFFDDGISGLTEITEREGGLAAVHAAERKEFDTLLVFAVDRLGREAYYVLHAFHHLRRLGVPIISATEVYDPHEPTGRFLISILAGKAENDKVTIYNRTQSGKEKQFAADDLYVGGVVPYGYMVVWRGPHRVYAVCEEEIPGSPDWTPRRVIELIFRRCLEGATTVVIAQELGALGLPTCWVPGDRRYSSPRRGYWYPQRVTDILHNPFYSGVQRIKRADGLVSRKVPQIVSQADAAAVRANMTKNRTWSDRNATQTYLLRGLIRCGTCGRAYCGSNHMSGRGPRGKFYRCSYFSSYTDPLRGKCTAHWVDGEQLEAEVRRGILSIAERPEEFLSELHAGMDGATGRAEALLDEAAALDRQRAAVAKHEIEYHRQRAEGLIRSDDVLRALLSEMEARELAIGRKAQAKREEAMAMLEREAQIEAAHDVVQVIRQRVAAGLTDRDWRFLTETLVQQVTVHTEGHGRNKSAWAEIEWQAGDTVKWTLTRSFLCIAA
jgi:site-specific DNA recombinase